MTESGEDQKLFSAAEVRKMLDRPLDICIEIRESIAHDHTSRAIAVRDASNTLTAALLQMKDELDRQVAVRRK